MKFISLNNREMPEFVEQERQSEMDSVLEELLKDREMEAEWVRLSWELPDLSQEMNEEMSS